MSELFGEEHERYEDSKMEYMQMSDLIKSLQEENIKLSTKIKEQKEMIETLSNTLMKDRNDSTF